VTAGWKVFIQNEKSWQAHKQSFPPSFPICFHPANNPSITVISFSCSSSGPLHLITCTIIIVYQGTSCSIRPRHSPYILLCVKSWSPKKIPTVNSTQSQQIMKIN